ncbi:DUF7563 family protein [Haladaptatus sp. NG-WS-4]
MPQSQHATRTNAGGTERRCQNCGSFITSEFARVFGNNDDVVFGCLECMSATEVRNGKARAETIDTSLPGTKRGTVR